MMFLVFLYTLLFLLLITKATLNYHYDVAEGAHDAPSVLHRAPHREEVKVRMVDEDVEYRKVFLSQRLREVKEIDIRAQFAEWKQNVEDYTAIRAKLTN